MNQDSQLTENLIFSLKSSYVDSQKLISSLADSLTVILGKVRYCSMEENYMSFVLLKALKK